MKIKRVFYCILFSSVLVLTSCHQKRISPDTMSSILADLYILDNAVSSNGLTERNKIDTMTIFKPVFEKYGYDLYTFQSSLNYYLEEEDAITKIYDEANRKLMVVKRYWDKVHESELFAASKEKEEEYYSNLPDSIMNNIYAIKSLQWQLKPDTSFVFFADTVNCTPYYAKWWDSVAVEILINDWNKVYRPYRAKACCDCYECICPEKCDTLEAGCACCDSCDVFHARIKEAKEKAEELKEKEEQRKELERKEFEAEKEKKAKANRERMERLKNQRKKEMLADKKKIDSRVRKSNRKLDRDFNNDITGSPIKRNNNNKKKDA